MTCSAGVTECVDDFILPMLAGNVSPSDVTEQVADDTVSLADAGILFPVDSAGILFPAVPAKIPFLAGPVGPVGPDGTLSPSDPAGILLASSVVIQWFCRSSDTQIFAGVEPATPCSVGHVTPHHDDPLPNYTIIITRGSNRRGKSGVFA